MLCFLLRFEVYLCGYTFTPVALFQLRRFSLDNMLGFRLGYFDRGLLLLGEGAVGGDGVLQDKVGELDALDLSAVRDKPVGGLRELPSLHPPNDMLGKVCLGALQCPDVPSLLVSPEIEGMFPFNLNSFDELGEQEIGVGWLG